MSQGKERPGIIVRGDFKLNSDPKLIKRIIDAVIRKQKEIGLNGYISCPKCTLGISGDPKTTHPEYIAGYCTGDCEMLQFDSDEDEI
jgi:ferredoxin-thioredoxin reductase catalytic subunit